ncbi:CRAL-TRIO domain-containing protein [Ephemerocybe angulata]|uniref:Phosphatidylinositol transfer protein SFH5 n=1 Tax=Ephemerocybe angulata TaxID=980116 RepID=A0A8H6IBM2_9AGAR|nr:CRAL-TRIO domain-containing protein [Tulosesus angulatus]
MGNTTAKAEAPVVAATPAGTAPTPPTPEIIQPPIFEAAPDAEAKDKEAEVEEPQNTLTSLFLEAEWKALKDFRAQLPEIFADAYPDKPNAKITPVTLWGISIDPTNPKADARVSVVLMKFLRARNLNPTAAREMLVNTLRWRESFNIEAALKEEFPEELFGNMGVVFGRDKGNRPVVYNLYGANPNLREVFSDVQRFIRWRVSLQERSVALLDFTEVDQLIQVHDYAGVSLTSRDANSKAAAKEATNIFGSHYPELLYKKFFINVPTLMNWIFWAFKALIPSATLAKMSVVGNSKHALKGALLPYIDTKQLPERYGGEAEAF